MQPHGQKVNKNGKKKAKRDAYDHRVLLNQFIKLALATPMPDILKKIVLWRMWGYYPGHFDPLNVHQIAFLMVKEGHFARTIDPEDATMKVLLMEDEAKGLMKLHLAKHEISTVVDKINKTDQTKNPFEKGGPLIV